MFTSDGRYEMVEERYISTDNSMNGALAALWRWQNVSVAAHLAVPDAVLVPTLIYVIKT